MGFTEKSCVEFSQALASKAPVPGGGGASAMVGALGAALGSMVCNLTIGKKAYREVEEDVKAVLSKVEVIRERMLHLVEQDAVVFEPRSKAYGIKAETPEENAAKDALMEEAHNNACTVPVDIVKEAFRCLELLDDLAQKGSRLAISDVGVGALFCKAALLGGRFNVIINTEAMKDREYASRIDAEVNGIVERGSALADAITQKVEQRIKRS
ncbi:MAG: cyclodeaminase/cyclohydrolase family protein [Bacillota bacterium]